MLEQFTGNLTTSFTPTTQGCAQSNGGQTIDGSLNLQAEGGAINLALVAHQMTVQLTSSGSPCTTQLNAGGAMDVTDQAGPRRFSESFTGLQATFVGAEAGVTSGTLDGTVVNTCLGTVQFSTDSAMQFPAASECPTDGTVGLARGDGVNARIIFSTTGVGFDFNADGSVDASVPTCAAAPQCSG